MNALLLVLLDRSQSEELLLQTALCVRQGPTAWFQVLQLSAHVCRVLRARIVLQDANLRLETVFVLLVPFPCPAAAHLQRVLHVLAVATAS